MCLRGLWFHIYIERATASQAVQQMAAIRDTGEPRDKITDGAAAMAQTETRTDRGSTGTTHHEIIGNSTIVEGTITKWTITMILTMTMQHLQINNEIITQGTTEDQMRDITKGVINHGSLF